MIRVVVADGDAIDRAAVTAVADAADDIEVVGKFGDGEGLLAEVEALRPNVAVVSLRLPGIGGPDVAERLRRRTPEVAVVLRTGPSEGAIVAALASGARSLISTAPADPDAVLPAIRWSHAGLTYIDPHLGAKVAEMLLRYSEARGPYGLTVQEMRILALLPGGRTNREIAEFLNLSINTVKTHVHHAMRKLDVATRHEAAEIASREGFA